MMAEPLLVDLTDDWVLDARDEYRMLAAELARRLASWADEEGRPADAIAWTRRALARDRLDEATHRLLISRLAAAGEGAQALVAYERCRAILRAEFGTGPSDETRALARSIRAESTPGTAAAPRTAAGATGRAGKRPRGARGAAGGPRDRVGARVRGQRGRGDRLRRGRDRQVPPRRRAGRTRGSRRTGRPRCRGRSRGLAAPGAVDGGARYDRGRAGATTATGDLAGRARAFVGPDSAGLGVPAGSGRGDAGARADPPVRCGP